MSGKLYPFSVHAPGSNGLNRQLAASLLGTEWATEAINCVIDDNGRLASRKGWTKTTTTPLAGTPRIKKIYEYISNAGVITVVSAANSKLYTGTTTLTDVTGACTITDNNWKFQNFNNKLIGWQAGHTPVVYTGTGNFAHITAGAGTLPTGHTCLSAFGRVWAVSSSTDKTTLKYSDLLSETTWSGGSSGAIDLKTVWPSGQDEIVALAEFNNYLVIFGIRSIIVYGGADDPTTMAVTDLIAGVGCVSRDTVVNIGTDLLFLSDSGVRLLSRTMEQPTMPLGDLSRNVRDYLLSFKAGETLATIEGCYHEPEGFYLLNMPDNGYTFVFDLRFPNQDGTSKVTIWRNIAPTALCSSRNRVLYLGEAGVIGTYAGYDDNDVDYSVIFRSGWTVVNEQIMSYLKFPKKAIGTFIGYAGATIDWKWAYDYDDNYTTSSTTLTDTLTLSEYGIAEYGIAEYSGGANYLVARTNPFGSGSVIKFGYNATISGAKLSLQKLDLLMKIGRI